MPFQMYCHTCSAVLTGTPQRCQKCGNVATLAPGTTVQGLTDQYILDSILGIGGMGIVYKAHNASGNDVVVKELYVDSPPDDLVKAQRQFRREADIQAQISHSAFAAGYGYFQDPNLGNRDFMAMEFVEGEDLEKVLTKAPGGKMDENQVLEIGIQTCEGLEVLHTHTDAAGNPDPLVHRDIKPANIILRPSGQIAILDLGIARQVTQSGATQARVTTAGTIEYVALEQIAGMPNPRSDIYSLAATLFHLVTGNPFQGDHNQRLREIDTLPPAWQPIFRRAIAIDHNLRQRNVGIFRQDLINLLPAHLQAPYGTPAPPPVPPPTGQPVSISWKASPAAAMINPGEYRAAVAGRVMHGSSGMAGVTIAPLITDLNMVGTQGTQVTTSLHGDFTLDIPDVTVPVACPNRTFEVIVEDPNTGAELFRDNAVINRPWNARLRQAGGGVAHAGGVASQAIAWPFKILWMLIAAPFKGVGWVFRQLGSYGPGIKSWFQSLNKSQGPRILAATVALIALTITLYGISMGWTYIWTFCFWLTILSTLMFFFITWGKLKLGTKVIAFPSLLYYGIWLVMWFTRK